MRTRLVVKDLCRRLIGLLLACTMVQAAAPPVDRLEVVPTTAQARDFRFALDDYEGNRWPQAYAGFAQLADQGHAPAATLALHMLDEGTRRYGMPFVASRAQRTRWQRERAPG